MRPRIQRPTVRGVGASDAPANPLQLETPDGRTIPVASADFVSELSRLRVFAVDYALGTFLVIAERRKRGDRYWVARAYHQGRRASVYLGRAFDEADLRRAADELVERLGAGRAHVTGMDRTAVDAVVHDLVERERDPSRRAAAEAIAALVRHGNLAPRA